MWDNQILLHHLQLSAQEIKDRQELLKTAIHKLETQQPTVG